MITKSANRLLCNQIAGIFCASQQNTALCKASVNARLINDLNDYVFENHFLPDISVGRFYKLEIIRMFSATTGEPKSVMEYKLTDVVTGAVTYDWEDTPGRMPVYSKVPSMLSEDGLTIVSQNNAFSSQDFKQPRIVHKVSAPSYGIVYVAGSGGGTGGTPGGGGSTPGGGGSIIPTPSAPVEPNVPVQTAGMDFLNNPLLLIGIGTAAYFILTKKKKKKR